MQAIINNIQHSFSAMINVLALLLLIFFIYAIFGTFLFYELKAGSVINEYHNFWNFHESMITLAKIATGELWTVTMNDCLKVSFLAYPYFISFQIIVCLIMINMFIMVIL